jgi:tungstate transport system permease protein
LDFIIEGIQKAFQLIFTLDSEIFNIVLLSLRVSLTAVILASLLGVFLGFLMAVKDYWIDCLFFNFSKRATGSL